MPVNSSLFRILILALLVRVGLCEKKENKDKRVKTIFSCSFLANNFELQRYQCLYLMQNKPNLVEFAIRSKVTGSFYTLRIRKNTSQNRKDMFFFFLLRNNPYMTRIKAYKIDEARNIIFSLSEFCPEGNLQEFLDRYDALTENDVLLIFTRIVRSVLAIHENGYIHGDLRMETISMCQNNVPKLKTFKMRVVKDSIAPKRGTPLYMSPEALMDLFRPTLFFFQKSFDNYSLGVILYFMLHYKFPFYGNTYEELLINVTNRKILIDPELGALSKTLLSILLSNDANLRKDTRAIFEMVSEHTKNMKFSDFRKGVTKPLFEIYSPDKPAKESDQAPKVNPETLSQQTKIQKSLIEEPLVPKSKTQVDMEHEQIFNEELRSHSMGTGKEDMSAKSVDHSKMFNNMIQVPTSSLGDKNLSMVEENVGKEAGN